MPDEDSMTVGELIAKLSSYASDWPIVVRVCSMTEVEEGGNVEIEHLKLSVKTFDCVLDPEDVHAERGEIVFCVGNDALEEILGKQ